MSGENLVMDGAAPERIFLRGRWQAQAGWREVLRLAVPLVLSTSAFTLQHFVDRMFLCWHSPVTMAASLPAGLLSFTIISFFMGTASYANTFVAQYGGAGRPRRIGPALWQALYFAAGAACLMPLVIPLAGRLFTWIGHEPHLQQLEAQYFRIMMVGAGVVVYSNAISCFYTGRGRNWPVMWVNFGVTAINIVLDYAMIFGHFGLPAMGLAGAAWATNIACLCGALAMTVLVFTPHNRREYGLDRWHFDRALFSRLMRFGLPSGVQFMLDIFSFSFFTFLVGRIGTLELAATNLAFQVNTLSFMPMIGFGIAASTLVGQYLGANQPKLAARATWSTFSLTFTYMILFAVLYASIPHLFIDPFASKADPATFEQVRPMAIKILYFVALYCMFDTMNVIFASALKGAGDTRFVMYLSLISGWVLMVLPTWVWCVRGNGGIYLAWAFLSFYVMALGFCFLARFLYGRWKTMRVIEQSPVREPAVGGLADVPTGEVDL